MYYMQCPITAAVSLPVGVQAVVVHETVGEGDDVGVHPVLCVQQAHRIRELRVLQELVDSLKQRLPESQLLGFLVKHSKNNNCLTCTHM